jgi:hypothetical protein
VARSALESLARILDGLGIEWMLFGALAANLYRAETRLTGDTDVLVASAERDGLDAALRSAGWEAFRATPDGSLLRVRHATFGIADLVFSGTDYERGAIGRSRREELAPGLIIRVPTPEDVVVFKLIAGRAKDLADIESVLDANRVLDEGYIEQWAAEWDVAERWRLLRSEHARLA